MKRHILYMLLATVSSSVFASEDNTVTVGYAQSKLEHKASSINMKGVNLKYRYEFNSNLSVIGSLTVTKDSFSSDYDYGDGGRGAKVKVDVNYTSLSVGPSYRFNEYISAYTTIGGARLKGKLNAIDYNTNAHIAEHADSSNAFVYTVGAQINPIPNLSFDASYESARFNGGKGDGAVSDVGTWSVGVGYRF